MINSITRERTLSYHQALRSRGSSERSQQIEPTFKKKNTVVETRHVERGGGKKGKKKKSDSKFFKHEPADHLVWFIQSQMQII